MTIYYAEQDVVMLCRQLLRLNEDCVRLQWSKAVGALPEEVSDALYTVRDFIEAKLHQLCPDAALELTDQEESALLVLVRSSQELRKSIGSGVVLAGDEAGAVQTALRDRAELSRLLEPLASGKSLVLL